VKEKLPHFTGKAAGRVECRAMKPVRTPCIGICSTTSLGDRICRGCKRFAFEVIHWNSYSEEQKRAVQARIDQFTSQLMADKFQIYSPQKLLNVLNDLRVFYDPDLSPYFWLHQLLQKYSHRLGSLEEAGVRLQSAYHGWDVRDVLLLINEQLQVLSEAHYERYFQRGGLQ
jgi:predicted Fe-S protein YdhL (DUF1289 family)